MTDRSGFLTGVVVTLVACGAAVAGWRLFVAAPPEAAKSSPPAVPATVPKPFKEDQAAAVTLTADAEARLGVKTGKVERKAVKRVRVYGGEVLLPPGRAVVVSAPLAGVLRAASDSVAAPAAGAKVKLGDAVFQLLPLLDPVGRANLSTALADAEGQVASTGEAVKVAKNALDRAKSRLKTESGTKLMVDEAADALSIAERAQTVATTRRDLLKKVIGDIDSGKATPIPVEVPEDGLLRTVSALPGQTVPSGAALFEVINLDRVWVRAPVYVGDLPDLDAAATATVGRLTARPGEAGKPAEPVTAPPAANPTAGTVDLFYGLDNRETGYSPGQRVGVTIPLKVPAESQTVPWSAVVHDIHGGSWVYEPTGERAYTRRRVVVRYVVGDTAVLADGPKDGTAVVTAGAAELFGTEAGFSK